MVISALFLSLFSTIMSRFSVAIHTHNVKISDVENWVGHNKDIFYLLGSGFGGSHFYLVDSIWILELEAFGVSVNSPPVVILLAVSKSSLRCGEEYRSSLSFWFVVLWLVRGFVSCSGKAVVVHRLRVHRSVVAVRWLHLCGFGACSCGL